MEIRRLGDYNLIKQIGQGSLGTVYLAEHRFMKKQYVLKVLPQELAVDRGFIQRFEDDVSILATLEHPHIVKIHNVSFSEGQYFLVTDCTVDDLGETTNLAQYMMARGKRLEESELLRLLRQIAEALDYAHSKKVNNKEIVHRGIKLNNILVSKGETGIDLKLADFGLSRILGSGAVLSRTYKMVAETLGIPSPYSGLKMENERYPIPPVETQKLIPLHASFLQSYAFLAPEQKRLDSPFPVDAKADIYAFGILAYYLIMGEAPEGFFEMPSTKAIEYKWNWDQLIQSCLQAHPAKRPEALSPLLDNLAKEEDFYAFASVHTEPEDEVIHAKPKPLKVSAPSAKHIKPTLKPLIRSPHLDLPTHDQDPSAAFLIDTTVKNYEPERKDVSNIQPLHTEMIVIPGGTFYRGSNDGNRDEMPRHQIDLNSFAIDIHPVTNEQFVRFLEVMGGEKDCNHNDIVRLRESRIKRSGGKLSIESGYAKHPVVGVTWYGAIAYARWMGKRLPFETEWEIASRGGSENALYPTGGDIEKTQANFFSSDTTAVMSYPPNAFNLYDIPGNVYEWCADWYGYNYYEMSIQEPDNPQGPLQGVYRVLRGGCWKSLKEDLRCSRRHRNNPGTVNGTYGFRCAADAS